ncbi:hypothetical protein EDD85DRAFT_94829 [Armillaria nabsnona]|nr:hypothetical protein EDD85DRAFT_94829 [Armillaria nabsnona]
MEVKYLVNNFADPLVYPHWKRKRKTAEVGDDECSCGTEVVLGIFTATLLSVAYQCWLSNFIYYTYYLNGIQVSETCISLVSDVNSKDYNRCRSYFVSGIPGVCCRLKLFGRTLRGRKRLRYIVEVYLMRVAPVVPVGSTANGGSRVVLAILLRKCWRRRHQGLCSNLLARDSEKV